MPNASEQDHYDQARRQFDELGPEDQAQFLIEATASSLARGIESVGTALAQNLEDAVRCARRDTGGDGASGQAAQPETSQRRQPRDGSHGSSTDGE